MDIFEKKKQIKDCASLCRAGRLAWKEGLPLGTVPGKGLKATF